MVKLSKTDILEGRDSEHVVYFEELGGEIVLRPLTDGQWARISAIKGDIGKIVTKPSYGKDRLGSISGVADMLLEVDLKRATENEAEADAQAVAYSLSDPQGEKWTVEDIRKMKPAGVVKKIAAKVYYISGVSKEAAEWAKSFRGDGRGVADSISAHDGQPADEKAE